MSKVENIEQEVQALTPGEKVGKYRTVQVGLQYRALAVDASDNLLWFWIGSHSEYDKLVG